MKLDLSLEGFALLYMFSTIFGLTAHLILARSSTPWMWLIGSIAYFIGGFIASEVFFGYATVDEIQPVIGGLAVDEALFGGLLVGVPVVLVTWYLARHGRLSVGAAT